MSPLFGYINVLSALPIMLAHLAGVVVALILLIRQDRRRAPSIFALVGFGLLLAVDVAKFTRGPIIRQLLHRTAVGDRAAVHGVSCCCGLFDVAAMACLILALWQALASSVGEGAG
ncbi:MAG: hypothetical protein PVJ55_11935 [Anaerolineae bacterium]